ncbi:MAG: hypothetical protein ACI9Z4_001089 [Polaribacter sp.]|jgi:hypothetical protein
MLFKRLYREKLLNLKYKTIYNKEFIMSVIEIPSASAL